MQGFIPSCTEQKVDTEVWKDKTRRDASLALLPTQYKGKY